MMAPRNRRRQAYIRRRRRERREAAEAAAQPVVEESAPQDETAIVDVEPSPSEKVNPAARLMQRLTQAYKRHGNDSNI